MEKFSFFSIFLLFSLGFGDNRRQRRQLFDDGMAVERRFPQILDHFNPRDDRIFQQRYFENFRFHRPCGPIFLIVGGEGPVMDSMVTEERSLTTILAKQFGGALIVLEHRYYGESFPTANRSNFEFLSSRLAVEDLGHFIRSMNRLLSIPRPRWILFGCSYPGSLATWFRSKYPELSLGAISISAPLDIRMNFGDYKIAVSDALWRIDEQCASRLRDAFELLNAEIQSRNNWPRVFAQLNIPQETVDSTMDMPPHAVLSALIGNILFALGAQIQTKNAANIRMELCDRIIRNSRLPLIPMLAAVSTAERADGGYDLNGWSYQLCTEFGWFITADSGEIPRERYWPDLFAYNATLEEASAFCRLVIGDNFQLDWIQPQVAATRQYYGTLADLSPTNVLFIEGENDPWRPVQMQSHLLKPSNVLFIAKDSTHCEGIYITPNNQPVREAQSLMFRSVDEWLRRVPCSRCELG